MSLFCQGPSDIDLRAARIYSASNLRNFFFEGLRTLIFGPPGFVPSNVFKDSTGRSPIFSAVLGTFWVPNTPFKVKLDSFQTLKVPHCTCVLLCRVLCLQMYSKTAQDARQFFSAVLGPFWVPNTPFRVKLDPFRTPKVQWGTCVLLLRVLNTSCPHLQHNARCLCRVSDEVLRVSSEGCPQMQHIARFLLFGQRQGPSGMERELPACAVH